jgi:hypothetical protein
VPPNFATGRGADGYATLPIPALPRGPVLIRPGSTTGCRPNAREKPRLLPRTVLVASRSGVLALRAPRAGDPRLRRRSRSRAWASAAKLGLAPERGADVRSHSGRSSSMASKGRHGVSASTPNQPPHLEHARLLPTGAVATKAQPSPTIQRSRPSGGPSGTPASAQVPCQHETADRHETSTTSTPLQCRHASRDGHVTGPDVPVGTTSHAMEPCTKCKVLDRQGKSARIDCTSGCLGCGAICGQADRFRLISRSCRCLGSVGL